MHKLHELKEMLIEHLEEYADKGISSGAELKEIDTLAHAAKNIGKVIEMCEENGSSFRNAPGYRGVYRNRRRDSMGRYSREDGVEEHDGHDAGYAEAKSDMVDTLERKFRESHSEDERRMLRGLINEMQQR